jgi:hypothetical protein
MSLEAVKDRDRLKIFDPVNVTENPHALVSLITSDALQTLVLFITDDFEKAIDLLAL